MVRLSPRIERLERLRAGYLDGVRYIVSATIGGYTAGDDDEGDMFPVMSEAEWIAQCVTPD